MNRKSIINSAVLVVLMIGIAALLVPRGEAADSDISSTVQIASITVGIDGVQSLAFGLLEPPGSGGPPFDTWTIDPCDPGDLTGPAGGGQDPFDDHSRGKFNIVGSPNFEVQYSVTMIQQFQFPTDVTPLPELSVGPTDLCPESPRFLDGFGNTSPVVGGVLKIFQETQPGAYTGAEIEMTADYN